MAAATPHNPLHQMALIPPSPNNTKSHRPSLISINHSTSKNPIRALTTSKNNHTRVRVRLRVRVAVICCCASHSQTQTVNNHNDNNNSNSNNSNSNKYGRILLSDVAVKRKRRVYWGRKWTSLDVATAGVVVAMHGLCVLAPLNFNWSAFWVAVVLYVVTGLFGITLSFHRNLAHRSFKLPKWVEYLFAYFGVQAMQGNPMDWVSTHRYHHQFCDSERDPHSPIEGFWFSHMTWLFDSSSVVQRCGGPSNVGDLEKQPFYRFLKRTYIIHPVALGVLLYGLGGFPFLVWGMGVRIVWVYHITWLVNSACHVWGRQSWNTRDLSRNNWWVALLAFGEGWHNNHHAFEFSARHGLEWYEFDMTWYVVRLLQAIGLATDVKVPSEAQKQKMSTPTLT